VRETVRALALHPSRKAHPYRIEVDGGVDAASAVQSAAAGADTFVAGTSLFAARDMAAAVAEMRRGAVEALAKSAAAQVHG
jgi:ribulose-phosphate 3-epimerase